MNRLLWDTLGLTLVGTSPAWPPPLPPGTSDGRSCPFPPELPHPDAPTFGASNCSLCLDVCPLKAASSERTHLVTPSSSSPPSHVAPCPFPP